MPMDLDLGSSFRILENSPTCVVTMNFRWHSMKASLGQLQIDSVQVPADSYNPLYQRTMALLTILCPDIEFLLNMVTAGR